MSYNNPLLKSCRYYRGESSIPSTLNDDEVGFWLAEASAIDAMEEGSVYKLMSAYEAAGEPGKATNLNPILLASLFFHFCKGSDYSPAECVSVFEEVYLPRYMASTSM
ncbi:MAG: hypothetical protein NC418_04480 [Muribaculaceae bacterium]|nr:hypothetical protein [Muribaculaceae bacterium]